MATPALLVSGHPVASRNGYPLVYKKNTPEGLRGKLCAIVGRSGLSYGGAAQVTFVFEDGTRLQTNRCHAVRADSVEARKIVANVARGNLTPSLARRKERGRKRRASDKGGSTPPRWPRSGDPVKLGSTPKNGGGTA